MNPRLLLPDPLVKVAGAELVDTRRPYGRRSDQGATTNGAARSTAREATWSVMVTCTT